MQKKSKITQAKNIKKEIVGQKCEIKNARKSKQSLAI